MRNEISIKSKSDLLNLLSLKLSLYQDPYDVDGVIATSSDILSSFPNNQRALYSRALAYEKIGDLANMSKDFELMIMMFYLSKYFLKAFGSLILVFF